MNFRIGEGWDVHALVPGRRLVIGGVEIAHPTGLLGHSDADVLLHAITDAWLGAAARRVRAAGFEIGNIDSTVVAQAPRLAAHIPGMRVAIARAVGVAEGQVNVKAKTAERLGPVGQGLAMEARAIALVYRA